MTKFEEDCKQRLPKVSHTQIPAFEAFLKRTHGKGLSKYGNGFTRPLYFAPCLFS